MNENARNAMEEDEEGRRSPSDMQPDVKKTSQAPVGGGKKKNGDIKKLVRSEVKRIMEAQHQSMMSMLDTAGTLILNNLEQTTNGQQHHGANGSLSSNELESHQDRTDQILQVRHEQQSIAGPSNAIETTRSHGVGGDSFKGKRTKTYDSEVQVGMGAVVAAQESVGTNGVPPLKLEDLASSREPGYHQGGGQQSARNIPGMITGFPLLTLPKDSGRRGEEGLGMVGGSEYDLIPTRERDSAMAALPDRKDIVLLRILPERTGASLPSRRGPIEPPLYKQSFNTYDTRTPRGPPNYAPSGTQPQIIGGMPLLRILPEKDYKLPVAHHSNVLYSQMAQPKMMHPPNPIGQHGPPGHTPREAWGNPSAAGTYPAYRPQGKIDIPLLGIDTTKPFPAAPQLMHQVPLNSQVQSEYHTKTERTRINLPLLCLKDPEPQLPLQPNFQRPLHPKLPIVSPEEILAYQQEKRRRELEREEEFRKQNGGPMQLLHLKPEPSVDVLATTSRQRRRERLESKENDPRTGLEPGQKNAKIRKSDTQPKDNRRGRLSSKANDSILKEILSDEEDMKQTRHPKASPRGRVVMVMPKEDETVSSRQRAEEEEEEEGVQVGSDNKMELEGIQRSAVTRHDVETQVSALGAGYALKPGSHDEALEDHDARPLYPTSAQIHYETIMKLQQPPPLVKTREAETQMKDVREAGTSMEGREGLDIIQERLARGRTNLSREEAKPTVEEVEEQYTRAATGLNKAGNIIAPDIFFGLRFRSGEEQASKAGPDTGQPGSSGRDFIHVADINAEDVFRDIPQHPNSRRRREDDNFQHPERDGSSGRSPGEKEAKRRREDGTHDTSAEQEDEDQATIAELHYNSLFHRDAVPADGLALLEDEEEMDGAERRKRIGDEVTRKLLETKLDKAERGMKLASEISSSRNQSKDRIQHQLSQMNERLGAIDEVSQSMQRDFNNTKLLLHTVENLSEAMAQGPANARPRPDYSLNDYKGPKTDASPKSPPPSSDHRHGDEGARQKDEARKDDEQSDVNIKEEEINEEDEKEDEKEEREEDKEEDKDDVERTLMTEGNLTLGISGISGVSDIIAEVIAGDDVDADEFGLTEQQKRAAKKRVQTRHDSFNEEDLADIPLTSLTDRQLRQIFSPRSATSPEEKTKPWPFAAKPEGRSAEERQKIKDWMERRRAQQIEEYKKKRGEKIEREHRPFRHKGDSLKQIPTSTKEIKRAEEEKKTKKQIKTRDHHEDRIAQAKDLMGQIFEDKPSLPPRPLIETRKDRSNKLRKQATSSMRGTATPTARHTQQPSSRATATPQPSVRTAATPQPRTGADPRMLSTRLLGDRSNVVRNDGRGQQSGRPLPKGTYMFIDSEAYRGPVVEGSRRADDHEHHQERGQIEDRRQEHPAYRGSTDRRPPRRSLRASMERSVQFADPRRSSEEDLQLVLAEMSDLVTPRSEDDDQENASSHQELESATGTYHKPKAFTDVVRVQRPEVTRKREGTPRKAKTYTDMLQDMKAEVSSSRAPSSVKSKQRLYGSTRLPGWNKNRKQYTKTPKTYTERLAEMRGAQGSGGQGTRLVQRPKPRPSQQERLGTATMTIGPSRRQQVERRGITPEPGPRSSTPYTAMLAQLSNSGTHRGREPIVSPRANPGMRVKPRAHEPVPYVDRLKQNAAEAPPTKHRTVYGAKPVPTGTYYTHKAPPLRTPSPRHQPYEMGTRQPGRMEDETSDVSGLSPWSVSDDVRRLLEEDDDLDEGLETITEPQYEISDIEDQEYGDYAASVDLHELEDIASVGSGSIMSNIDWDAIDQMIETVK